MHHWVHNHEAKEESERAMVISNQQLCHQHIVDKWGIHHGMTSNQVFAHQNTPFQLPPAKQSDMQTKMNLEKQFPRNSSLQQAINVQDWKLNIGSNPGMSLNNRHQDLPPLLQDTGSFFHTKYSICVQVCTVSPLCLMTLTK